MKEITKLNSHSNELDGTRLSPHFTLSEFLNVEKYPDNKPSLQVLVNLAYGCLMLLEPARREVGPISSTQASATAA